MKNSDPSAEIEEYARLDGELVDAMIAGDDELIEEVNVKIREFESRSRWIDFTEKPDKSDKPFQPSLISPDTVYIPIGNYSGLSYEQQQEQENSNDIPTNRD